MGGPVTGGRALELGCGRGVGIETILRTFEARVVDAFDLDPTMVARARRRSARHDARVRLWIGDATTLPVASATYDAVFDYGILHHVPDWRRVLDEVARVLKPGGRFYGEEVLAPFATHPLVTRFFDHPTADRFTGSQFADALVTAGLTSVRQRRIGRVFAWFVATKPAASIPPGRATTATV
jgi:ubiquinone/menaquinone biosynthesis C-methylase UbiE